MNLNELKMEFEKQFGKGAPTKIFFAPGRVNLIGEHIDYNGGYVFPAALTLGITALWRPRTDRKIVFKSLEAPNEVVVDIDGDMEYDAADEWGSYPKGICSFLKKDGYKLSAGDVLFSSTLPDGAGLSSSAAIEVVTAFMLLTQSGPIDIDLTWLSQFAQRVENQYVGVNCGIMDQFSVANGKKDNAILLNCETLVFQHIPFMLKDHVLIIMNTGKKRELADSKYNERRAECDEVLEILNKSNSYTNLCSADLSQIDKLIHDTVLKKRAYHVVTENARVIESVKVLQSGDIVAFGKLLNASHSSLRDNYEVTGQELDTMVEEALSQPSCLGARMTGAGFGGCAIAIVENAKAQEFIKGVGVNYNKRIGIEPQFYTSSIGDGVHEIVKRNT